MKFEPPASTRNNGVRWLGRVPTHWSVVQSRRLFSERNQNAREGEQQLTVSQKHGVISQLAFIELEGRRVVQVLKGHDILKHVEAGDFVMSMRSFQGGLEYSTLSGSISSAYVPLSPIKWVHPGYFRYLFKSSAYIQQLQSTSDLVRDGQALRFANFSKVPLPVVPMEEQAQIATCLDGATTRIDALITKKTCFIELLREKRQTLITDAVTKGLEARAPMKDSGVTWLGRVPAHWLKGQLGKVAVSRCDGPFGSGLKSDHYTNEGVRVVRLQNIGYSSFRPENAAYISFDHWKNGLGSSHDVLPGDLLMAGLGDDNNPLGRSCVAPSGIGPALVKADCYRFRLGPRVDARYVALALSATARAECGFLANGATRDRLTLGLASSRVIPIPPFLEQQAIVAYLDRATARIDTLLAKTEISIELLRERRTALITAAVAGKIDFREAAQDNT